MPDAAGRDAAVLSDGQNDCHRAIVSDLVCLIGHVHASTKLVELDMTGEALPGDPEVATNIVVLDDVTPRYVRAQATLNSCNAGLGIALHRIPGHRNTKEMASPNPAARWKTPSSSWKRSAPTRLTSSTARRKSRAFRGRFSTSAPVRLASCCRLAWSRS